MSSHDHEKDRAIHKKNRKGTLSKNASPAKKHTSDAEFSDDTSPIEDKQPVHNIKDGKNGKMMR